MFNYQEARNLTHKTRQAQVAEVLELIKCRAGQGHYNLETIQLWSDTRDQLRALGFTLVNRGTNGTEVHWD